MKLHLKAVVSAKPTQRIRIKNIRVDIDYTTPEKTQHAHAKTHKGDKPISIGTAETDAEKEALAKRIEDIKSGVDSQYYV